MRHIIALARKDLRLMPRNKGGMFFTFAWPVLITVLFGFAFGGGGDGTQSKVRLAVVDEDQTDGSRAFLSALDQSFDLAPMARPEAETAVRRGQRAAFIVVKPGFGAASAKMFYGAPKEIEVGVDPARKAEAGMIEGLLMKQAAADMQTAFTDPAVSAKLADGALAELKAAPPGLGAELAPAERFLSELKTFMGTSAAAGPPSGGPAGWEPLRITSTPIARERVGPQNAFDVTFAQGVIWGLIGCVMTFGVSLVKERTHGTLVRLRIAPLSRSQILGGKALACFVSIILVELLLLAVATALGVRPSSYGWLAVAGLSAAVCFVGFMMLIAALGRTEETAAGAGWAVMMPMAMLGGAMVPQFIMPGWMQAAGVVSPIRWAVLAIEGAVWRQFTPAEMAGPCAILIAVGVVCFAAGTRGLREA